MLSVANRKIGDMRNGSSDVREDSETALPQGSLGGKEGKVAMS